MVWRKNKPCHHFIYYLFKICWKKNDENKIKPIILNIHERYGKILSVLLSTHILHLKLKWSSLELLMKRTDISFWYIIPYIINPHKSLSGCIRLRVKILQTNSFSFSHENYTFFLLWHSTELDACIVRLMTDYIIGSPSLRFITNRNLDVF